MHQAEESKFAIFMQMLKSVGGKFQRLLPEPVTARQKAQREKYGVPEPRHSHPLNPKFYVTDDRGVVKRRYPKPFTELSSRQARIARKIRQREAMAKAHEDVAVGKAVSCSV